MLGNDEVPDFSGANILHVILCEALTEHRTSHHWTELSDFSNPPSRHSSLSHLERKVLILDNFFVIRLPRIGVATFTKKAPETSG